MAKRTTSYLTRPGCVADPNSIVRDNGGRQVDWDLVPDTYRDGAFSVVADGVSAQAAVALTVEALPGPLPKGAVLRFGVDEFATLTEGAAEGETELAVEALVSAIEDGDTAVVGGSGDKVVQAFTVMCELASGKVVPRAARPGAETATCFIETVANENSETDSLSGYGMVRGGMLYENMLPDATGTPKRLPAQFKTELQTAGVGTGFGFVDYEDDRQ